MATIRRLRRVALVSAVALVACGAPTDGSPDNSPLSVPSTTAAGHASGVPLDVIVLPGADGSYPPDTEVQCAGMEFTLGDLQTLTPLADADPGLQAVVQGWIDGPEGGGVPADGWVLLTATDERATLMRATVSELDVIEAEMRGSGWAWSGSSAGRPCDVTRVLPSGLGQVDWVLDEAFPAPDASSTEIRVLATELACTSGSQLGDRLLGPQVVETDDGVRIAFAAIPLSGDATCPGNPSTAVTITLEQPLGDRALISGLAVAPLLDLIAAAS